jgi:hypothetical protein
MDILHRLPKLTELCVTSPMAGQLFNRLLFRPSLSLRLEALSVHGVRTADEERVRRYIEEFGAYLKVLRISRSLEARWRTEVFRPVSLPSLRIYHGTIDLAPMYITDAIEELELTYAPSSSQDSTILLDTSLPFPTSLRRLGLGARAADWSKVF